MRTLFVLLGAAALAAGGCGGGPAAVSGVVTLDGKPVEGATVSFSPEGAGTVGGSTGKTGPDGRYTLRTVTADKPGAAPGKHKVTISLSRTDAKNPDGAVTDAIPAKYNTKSELTFDVPSGGTDKADFALTK